MKVKDFITKLQELGYDDNTELDIDIIDGGSGDNYSLQIESIENGDWVGNENEIGVILKESKAYKKVLTENAAHDILEAIQETIYDYI